MFNSNVICTACSTGKFKTDPGNTKCVPCSDTNTNCGGSSAGIANFGITTSNTGRTVGIAIGSVVVVLLLAYFFYWQCFSKKKSDAVNAATKVSYLSESDSSQRSSDLSITLTRHQVKNPIQRV